MKPEQSIINPENKSLEQREKEKFPDLTIFTTTYYGADETSNFREKMAENFLANTAALNIKCIVIDGGSNQNFLKKIEFFKNVQIEIDPTLKTGESRRRALEVARNKCDTPYFLWTEPEKTNLITEESINKMIGLLRDGQADIVVPKRRSKDSLPKLQAWTESRAAKRTAKIMGAQAEEELDLWFGPKMFNRESAKYFLDYQGKLDKWDSIIVPVINAYKDGKRVSSVIIDYVHPPEQTAGETADREIKKKRVEQYVKILAEFDPYWKKKIYGNNN